MGAKVNVGFAVSSDLSVLELTGTPDFEVVWTVWQGLPNSEIIAVK